VVARPLSPGFHSQLEKFLSREPLLIGKKPDKDPNPEDIDESGVSVFCDGVKQDLKGKEVTYFINANPVNVETLKSTEFSKDQLSILVRGEEGIELLQFHDNKNLQVYVDGKPLSIEHPGWRLKQSFKGTVLFCDRSTLMEYYGRPFNDMGIFLHDFESRKQQSKSNKPEVVGIGKRYHSRPPK